MSKFLDELKDSVLSCDMEEKLPHRWVDNHEMIGSAIDMIDSLGENARRMLEIGVLQDELIKLGFTVTDVDLEVEDGGTVNITEFFSNDIYNYFDEDSGEAVNARFHIVFEHDICILHYTKENSSDDNYKFIDYSTFEDLINKVKELIND